MVELAKGNNLIKDKLEKVAEQNAIKAEIKSLAIIFACMLNPFDESLIGYDLLRKKASSREYWHKLCLDGSLSEMCSRIESICGKISDVRVTKEINETIRTFIKVLKDVLGNKKEVTGFDEIAGKALTAFRIIGGL